MKKGNKMSCREAERFYYDYLAGQGTSDAAAEFEHIKECPHCRQQVNLLQEQFNKKAGPVSDPSEILSLHHQCLSQWIDCDVVRPFLASLAHPGLSIRTSTPVTAHIDHCPVCRKDVQTILSMDLSAPQLAEATRILSNEPVNASIINDRQIAAMETIRDRKSSGIVTRTQVDEAGKPRILVRHAPGSSFSRRQFLGRFTAAAGILLIASLVIVMTTAVGGISLQEVYSAIRTIENCRIEIRDVEMESPSQKILISRKFNLVLSQKKNETIILDFENKRILKSNPQTGVIIEPSELKISSQIDQADFGLLPFDSVVDIPPGHQWRRQDLLSQEGDYDVYDLTWTENQPHNQAVEKRWRGYLQRYSHLPVRIEWFEKYPGRDEEKITETTIQYPDSETVMEELKDIPLYRLFKGDHTE